MNFSYTVNFNEVIGKNDRFWAAAGIDSLYPIIFTQSGEYLLSRMQEKGTLRYLRNHFTLSSLIKDGYDDCGGNAYSEDENGNPIYNFEKMNAVFGQYLRYGAKPIVEMDFLPNELCRKNVTTGGVEEGRYSNRSYPGDWKKWEDLIRAFTKNLVDTFGIDEVRTWYFEVWNEPDSWPMSDWPMFHRLYDVFVSAVTGVDDQLKVGGPGAFSLPFMKDFLEHVSNGTNCVTGEKGSRIDFISYHIYGMSGGWLDQWPLITPSVQRFIQQLMWLKRMIDVYPCLDGVPVHLNEWGVSSNYEKTADKFPPLEFRNSEYSPLFMIKLVDCIRKMRRVWNMPLELMLYWGFSMEDDQKTPFAGHRDLSTYPNIPKPILSAYELLARLGEDELFVEGAAPGASLGAMAGRSKNSVQAIIYNFNDQDFDAAGPCAQGSIAFTGLESGKYTVKLTRLDKEHHNTYRLWQTGASEEEIRQAVQLTPDEEFELESKEGSIKTQVAIPAHGLCLIELQKTHG